MRIQFQTSRLVLLTGLLLTIGIYLAIDQPAGGKSISNLAQASQPQLALAHVTLTKLGQ